MVLVKPQSVTFLNVSMNIEGNLRKISAVREHVSTGKFSDLNHVFEMHALLSSEAEDPDDDIPLNKLVQGL